MMTRRTLLGALAAGAGTLHAEISKPAAAVSNVPKLSQFGYQDVQLLDGPLRRQSDENHAFFLNLSEDRMLKIYRQRTGLAAPGENMGGWYDDFCPGASFGQYISALARFSAATNAAETRQKVARLVSGYAQTLHGRENFFVDLRYPAYTFDKLVCALIDAHSYAANDQATTVLRAMTTAARPHMPERALTLEEQHTRPHKDETYTWDETYTLAENLFLAHERTGDPTCREMAPRYLLNRSFFDPLSQGQNVLPGLHAYSHMNALSSGMQGFLKLNERKYYDAVSNSIEWIWSDQSFATGGWGPNEGFVEPGKGLLGASLKGTHRSFETPCGAYAHFKVMRYMLALTADSRYGDSIERVLYNTVLGAKPIREDGWSFYYSDYGQPGHKTDHRIVADSKWPWDHDGRWPCCSGTLPQVVSDYGISSFFRSPDGVYVNLFVPSRLTWQPAAAIHCQLTVETNYPVEDLVRIKVEPSAETAFAVRLRIPAWAGPQTYVAVNGKRFPTGAPRPGSFFAISRSWNPGDLIELDLDSRIRTEAVDRQTPDQVAILRGPLVLFAKASEQPVLSRSEASSLHVTRGQDQDWHVQAAGRTVAARSFYEIGDEQYQTYWRIAKT